MNRHPHYNLASKFISFLSLYLINFRVLFSTSSPNGLVNLSYDLNDKYKSEKALVIAHGLFASKLSWRAIARRINDQTKQKVIRNYYLRAKFLNVRKIKYINLKSILFL